VDVAEEPCCNRRNPIEGIESLLRDQGRRKKILDILNERFSILSSKIEHPKKVVKNGVKVPEL
jgi:hypothetical protein